MPPLPPCLSIRQPWAWLITAGGKDVENRTWRTAYRGWFLIHAPARIDTEAVDALRTLRRRLPTADEALTGGLVGIAQVIDCVTDSPSAWFSGPYGFVLADAQALPFIAMPGRLSFFAPPAPAEAAVRAVLRGHAALAGASACIVARR